MCSIRGIIPQPRHLLLFALYFGKSRHPSTSMSMTGKTEFLDAYDRYADALYRHCFFRVFSKARAEELTQETFMKAWEYLAEGKEVQHVRAFLYRIANNLLIDESRKKKEVSLDALLEESNAFEPSYGGENDMERKVLIHEVIEGFKCLDRDERTVLVMRYLDDLDPKEIAEILGMTANNVSVRMNRALKKVRKEL